ncbi:MAG: hypothetical protein HAW60_00175 [Bdellovibrionales bacterium]|nr:hypothetical protein [Bdellovibrionales bacterium]
MKSFKYFLSLFFILFSQNVLAQEITLVWGDTLSKLIFQYHDRDISNWKEVLPLYLSLNPQIKNENLIYAGSKLNIPSQEDVVDYLNSKNTFGLEDIGVLFAGKNKKQRRSLIDHVANPWSLELQAGPYFKLNKNNSSLEYFSKGGFDIKAKGVYHFNDKYSVGVIYRYSKKSYELSSSLPLSGIYLEAYMNWNKFIVSALFGSQERLTYNKATIKLLTASHFDYGIGLHYRLLQTKNFEGLVGLNSKLFTKSTSFKNGMNKNGYAVMASTIFNYNFWKNHLIGLESSYSLSKGKNKKHESGLEDFVTRLSLQFSF